MAMLRSVIEMALKSPFLCVNRLEALSGVVFVPAQELYAYPL